MSGDFFFPDQSGVRNTSWTVVDDITEFQIAPTATVSPARILAESVALDCGLSLVRRRTGPDADVVEYHAKSAFAHLSKSVVQRLKVEYGIDGKALAKAGVGDSAEGAALALLKQVCPDMDEANALLCLENGHDVDKPEDTTELQPLLDDVDLMDNVVSRFEANSWRAWCKGQQNKVKEHVRSKAVLIAALPLMFVAAAAVVGAAAAGKEDPDSKSVDKAKKYNVIQRGKWISRLAEGDLLVVQEFKPPVVRVNCEDSSKCLRVLYNGKRIKSFAWHLRGTQVCIEDTLRWCWEFALEKHGLVNPNKWLVSC